MTWARDRPAYFSLTERPEHDIYPTPAGATRAILAAEFPISGPIWEPACGFGHMSEVIIQMMPNTEVYSSDLVDYGYGSFPFDFLEDEPPGTFNTIITNPPFSLAERFIERARELAPLVIMLVRLEFTSGLKRGHRLNADPPSRIWVHSAGLPFVREGVWVRGGNFRHAWLVWDKNAPKKDHSEFRWLPEPIDLNECEP